MILAQFRIEMPEFNGVSDTMVQAYLDAALLELDSGVWGNKLDQGQKYLAAHRLASSSFGQNAKLVSKDGSTTYGTVFKEIMRKVTSGYRVI